MKICPLSLPQFLLACIYLSSCSSDNGENIEPDCSAADIQLELADRAIPGCNSAGSFTVNASGGEGVFNYSIDGENFQASEDFEDLESGQYTVIARDENGCTEELQVDLFSAGALTLDVDIEGCENGSGILTVTADGGQGSYTYSLNGGDFVTNSVFDNLSFGQYQVTVRDEAGCEVSSDVQKFGVSLASDIMPIINNNCAVSSCHLNRQAPLLLGRSDVIASAQAITRVTGRGSMPPTGSLPDAEIRLIADWVDCGAQDN